jgi:antitoxin VapB
MKTAKLFKNGQSQAVRLPKEFRMMGTEVYIKKQGEAIVLLPKEKSWVPIPRHPATHSTSIRPPNP